MEADLRKKILSELAKYTGKRVPWQFIKQTSRFVPDIDRFHNLITGIFKPAWSEYALSIVIRTTSQYNEKDEVIFLDDGRWLMTYSPRSGGLQIADNRALVRCMDDRVPVGVFHQLTDKTDRRHGSTYRILGLGLITGYDAKRDVFIVEGADQAALEIVTSTITNEVDRYEVQLYAQVMNAFLPFLQENSVTYTTTSQKRDNAFREIVIREYGYSCAVCGMKFRFGGLTEATAAHIIPKNKRGTDDPRNGLSLCHNHHWAFDSKLFSLTDNYEIMLAPSIHEAECRNFPLLEMEGRSISLPANETLWPHIDALKWHRRNAIG